jgi:hypothetical protein
MGMKEKAANIVGRKITGLVLTEGDSPAQQMFLILDNDCHFEIYGGRDYGIRLGGNVYAGGLDHVRKIIEKSNHDIRVEVTEPGKWVQFPSMDDSTKW